MSIDINLSSQDGSMTETDEAQDEVLQELRTALDPIMTKIDEDQTTERAVFMIGTKEVTDNSGEYVGVQTYFDVTGDHGLLQEAMYMELMALIDSGEPELFESLRQVVKQIEEEKGLEEHESLLTSQSRVLH